MDIMDEQYAAAVRQQREQRKQQSQATQEQAVILINTGEEKAQESVQKPSLNLQSLKPEPVQEEVKPAAPKMKPVTKLLGQKRTYGMRYNIFSESGALAC